MAEPLREWLVGAGLPTMVAGFDLQVAPLFGPAWLDFSAAADDAPAGPFADLGVRYLRDEAFGGRFTFGPAVDAAERAYRRTVAELVSAGIIVIVDEVCRTDEAWADWKHVLAGLDVLWVGIRCDDETLREREAARGDRLPGLGPWTNSIVHVHPDYDVELDSTTGAPTELLPVLQRELLRRWSDLIPGSAEPRPSTGAPGTDDVDGRTW